MQSGLGSQSQWALGGTPLWRELTGSFVPEPATLVLVSVSGLLVLPHCAERRQMRFPKMTTTVVGL